MKNVLFVCVHNSGRSQMAEAFFNRLAEGRATAASAGSQPDDAVDPTVVEVMREVGVDISGKVPRRLVPEIVDAADRVVIMGCGVETACPVTFVETEDWGLDDPKGQPIEVVRRIRDEIRARVENLIGELNP